MADFRVPIDGSQYGPNAMPQPRQQPQGVAALVNDAINRGLRRYGGPHLSGALLGTQQGQLGYGQPARGGLLSGAAELSPGADVRDMLQGSGQLMQGLANADPFEAALGGGLMGAATLGMAIPGSAGGYRQAAQEVAEEVAPQGIRAYHGSPHSFDAFDMNQIGTGEGAQAYGHGLYFAEAEDVARSYRDAITDRVSDSMTPQGAAERALGAARGNVDEAKKTLQSNLDAMSGTPREAEYKEAIRLLDEGYGAGGSMYEVNIRANPEDFLDWDRPLSEQSKTVRGALSGIYADDALGSDIVRQMADDARTVAIEQGRNAGTTLPASQSLASQSMQGLGIPGIRYLDQGSRGAGEGSRNYVTFSDKIVDILRKYGIAGVLGGGAGAAALSAPDQAQAQPVNPVGELMKRRQY